MKAFLAGMVMGIFVPIAAAIAFVESGGMPVATRGQPLPFERTIAHISLHKAIGAEGDAPSPIPASEPNLLAGAQVYREQCAVCHGLPNAAPSAIAQGLFPKPPQLLKPGSTGVTDDPAGESFWKVKNGIRLTGMPGYVDSLTETQMWQVSLLLAHAHELPASVADALGPKAR